MFLWRVAAVPEGLPAILSVVLSIDVQQMAKQNAIVKNFSSVETLGSSSVIATDKTGPLTKNEMTILRVITSNGVATLEGVGYASAGRSLVQMGRWLGISWRKWSSCLQVAPTATFRTIRARRSPETGSPTSFSSAS